MTVYLSKFALLTDNELIITTNNEDDCMIVPYEAWELLAQFMTIRSFTESELFDVVDEANEFGVTRGGNLLWNGRVVLAENASDMWVENSIFYKGYIFIILGVGSSSRAITVVISGDGERFVGSVSRIYGTKSSAELSRVILMTPEFMWDI